MTALVGRDTPIAVCAPCGVYDVGRFERGLLLAREAGFDLQPLPGLLEPHRYLAGTDVHRRSQLHQALTSPDYGAVWIARGGYGLTRILDDLDLDGAQPRPVIGFSDVTALHNLLLASGLGPAVHGPVVHSLPITDDRSLEHLWALLDGRPTAPLTGVSWVAGSAEGPLVGGNLCLLAATCGTGQQLDTSGCILVLEEVGEPAYRVDRMLQQLTSAGLLDGLVGVAIGEFRNCRVPEGVDWTIRDVLIEHLGPLGIPVLADLPIGHGSGNHAWVAGRPGRLSEDRLDLLSPQR